MARKAKPRNARPSALSRVAFYAHSRKILQPDTIAKSIKVQQPREGFEKRKSTLLVILYSTIGHTVKLFVISKVFAF